MAEIEKEEEFEFTHMIEGTSFFCGEKLPNGEVVYCEECRLRKEKELGYPMKQEPIEVSEEIIEDKNENNDKT